MTTTADRSMNDIRWLRSARQKETTLKEVGYEEFAEETYAVKISGGSSNVEICADANWNSIRGIMSLNSSSYRRSQPAVKTSPPGRTMEQSKYKTRPPSSSSPQSASRRLPGPSSWRR